MPDVLFWIVVLAGGLALVWWGSDWLEESAGKLAAHYELPAIVQGAVIAAIGSSFPELSSTVLATLLHGEFDLGVGVVVGSAIFNILVIPGVAGLVGKPLSSNRMLVYKDAQFYVTSVVVLLLVFSFAVIYRPVEGEVLTGEMGRLLALVPILLYVLYIFLQQQDTKEDRAERYEEGGEIETEGQTVPVLRHWGRLVLSLAIILVGVEGLVQSAIFFGDFFDTPSFLWGITVLAAGTSLPDLLISVRAARRDEGIVSLANVLGSNIFDLLVAVPAGVLVAGVAVIDFTVAAPMMGFLTLATLLLFTALRTHLVLARWEAWMLLVTYLVFIIWMTLETFGVISFVIR